MNIVVVSQNGCNPCVAVKNFLKDEEVDFQEVNLSETPEAKDEYEVMSTPVTILFDEGEEVARVIGYSPGDLMMLVNQS